MVHGIPLMVTKIMKQKYWIHKIMIVIPSMVTRNH